jgi:hypothetical protein
MTGKYVVSHIDCGHVGYYTGEFSDNDNFSTETFEFLDGTKPNPGEKLSFKCQHCGEMIDSVKKLIRWRVA